jgi:hypothetical protein
MSQTTPLKNISSTTSSPRSTSSRTSPVAPVVVDFDTWEERAVQDGFDDTHSVQEFSEEDATIQKVVQSAAHFKVHSNKNPEQDLTERLQAFSFSSTEDVPPPPRKQVNNKFTKLCSSLETSTPCRHKHCTFAHSLDQLVITECRFDMRCRSIRQVNGIVRNNPESKPCCFIHSGETKEQFVSRTGADKLSPPVQKYEERAPRHEEKVPRYEERAPRYEERRDRAPIREEARHERPTIIECQQDSVMMILDTLVRKGKANFKLTVFEENIFRIEC